MISAEEIAIIRQGLGPERYGDEAARALIEQARALGADPFRLLALHYPVSETRLYDRAAQVCDFAYSDDIAAFLAPMEAGARPEALAHIRSVRGVVQGREVLFIAPDFDQLLALNSRLGADDPLRGRICIVPPTALRRAVVETNSGTLMSEALTRLSRLWPRSSAHLELTRTVRYGFVLMLIVMILAAVAAPYVLQPILIPLVTLFLGATSAFRVWAAFTNARNIPLDSATLIPDSELPLYSVMIPLRNEAHMVPQIVAAMRQLDYPEHKLDILFIVESKSEGTIAAIAPYLDDPRFELVVVPDQPPGTKPKALNYALPLVRGKHVVVFDAEDIPERAQLRKAATLFDARPDIACLQAELVIDNADTNWLTRMFAAEYAGHFGVLLPGIARVGLPMPLGGTSNHFRAAALRAAGGWDSFNVTEDADLGIRFARLDLKVASFAARTYEEAPTTVAAWLRQRTRWMKGWMQTVIVHNREPSRLLSDLGWRGFLAVQIFVGGLVVATALHGIFLLAILLRIILNLALYSTMDIWSIVHLVVLLLGYCGAAAVSVLGLSRLGRPDLAATLVGLPAYWLLGGLASYRACAELLARPFHWSKTAHLGSRDPLSPGIAGPAERTFPSPSPLSPRDQLA